MKGGAAAAGDGAAGASPKYESIGLWTNKGGVGKTTLTFHLSTVYAYLNPDKRVLVVDMCPQANLSNTLLTSLEPPRKGSEVVAELKQTHNNLQAPRTVAGYLHRVLNPMTGLVPVQFSDFLVKLDDHNNRMPENMWLLCGDSRLDDLTTTIANAMHQPVTPFGDPFKNTLSRLRFFFEQVLMEAGWAGKEVVVFIDSNPAFTEYTQLALCSMDKLVVPVNADDFSLQAVDYMFNKTWGLFADDDPFTSALQSDSFAAKACKFTSRQSLLPKIATIIHNRHNVYALRVVAAFQQLQEEATSRIYAAHKIARQQGVHVFVNRGDPDPEQFNRLFTGTMREMFATGVVSAHTGVPLHKVWEDRAAIKASFGVSVKIQKDTTLNLVADLLKVLSVVTEDFDFTARSVSQNRLLTLLHKQSRDEIKALIKWTRRKKALRLSLAAAAAATGAFPPDYTSDGSEDEYPDFDEQAVSGGVVGRAFRLKDNSCGPDVLTVVAAVTMVRAASPPQLLSEDYRQLAIRTRGSILDTTRHPTHINTSADIQLAQIQMDVMQHLKHIGQLPDWEPGKFTGLEDLITMLCKEPITGVVRKPYTFTTQTTRRCISCGDEEMQPEEQLCRIELTGDDVISGLYGDLLQPSSTFDMEKCLQGCATLWGQHEIDGACSSCGYKRRSKVTVRSLPKWLPVLLSRSSADYFSVQDEAGTPVGPEPVSATNVMLYQDPHELVDYHLRAMFVLKGSHHTVYFRAGPGTEIDRAGLQDGWHFYDDANQGRIKFIDATYPVLQGGDLPCNISGLLYEQVPRAARPDVGSAASAPGRRAGCIELSAGYPGMSEEAAAVFKQARNGWLEKPDILQVLLHHNNFNVPLSSEAPDYPIGGNIFMFDKQQVGMKFRHDGYRWKPEKRSQFSAGEIDGITVKLGISVSVSDDGHLERRIYHVKNKLKEKENPARVVHYYQPSVSDGTCGSKHANDSAPDSTAKKKPPATGA